MESCVQLWFRDSFEESVRGDVDKILARVQGFTWTVCTPSGDDLSVVDFRIASRLSRFDFDKLVRCVGSLMRDYPLVRIRFPSGRVVEGKELGLASAFDLGFQLTSLFGPRPG